MLISILTVLTYKGVPPKTQNLFIKTCVFILTCLNFSHLQSTLHLMQYTYGDIFFHCSKQFLNLLILMSYKCFCWFFFHLFHIGKTFSFEDSFHPGKQTNKQNGTRGRDWVNREGRERGHAVFGQKLLNTQCGVGRCAHKSPIMKWAVTLKESSKQFTEAECSLSQQCQLVHC